MPNCPFCRTHIPDGASVCTGCGAELVRAFTFFGQVALAIAIIGVPFLSLVVTTLPKSLELFSDPIGLAMLALALGCPIFVFSSLSRRTVWRRRSRH